MKVVAIVPAKGNSNRINEKNAQRLDGTPLFIHMLEKLCRSDHIDEVWLDTESESFIQLADELPIHILKRDPQLASNAIDGHQLFYNEVCHIESDLYLQVLCTSPFIELSTLDQGIQHLKTHPEYDSAVLVREEKLYCWQDGAPSYPIDRIPNSVDLPNTTIETMGLYMVRKSTAHQLKRRIGDHPYLLKASPLEAIDVNWSEDFKLANLLAAGQREQENHLLKNISGSLSSALLSDLLDDMGYPHQVIKKLKPRHPIKLFGRAKTLQLRKLADGEPFQGIYHALESYETIVPNDIIIVDNEVGEYAYFGELNANLAIRAGAIGAIINGKTRDSQDVEKLHFPVFSQGETCQDVRKRATVASINKNIHIEGILIEPNGLLFADQEGVVVIPKKIEQRLIKQALQTSKSEKHLLLDISNDIGIQELVQRYGFF